MSSQVSNWVARILFVLVLGVFAAILFPFFARGRGSRRSSCMSNLKQIGLGIMVYTEDYDEKMPLVVTGHSAYGWADAIQPYLKSMQIYQCQQEPNGGSGNPRNSGYIDYPFNEHLSGKSQRRIGEPNKQILSLDGNYKGDVTDARYSLSQIPLLWQKDENSPLYRHLTWANYLFADGHVKALSFSQLEADKRAVF